MIEWRAVKGYEDCYEVSNYGALRAVARRIIKSDGVPISIRARVLVPQIRNGRRFYGLKRNGVRKQRPAAQLVAEVFIGGGKRGEVVRHLDDNPLNDYVANLAYGSLSDNMYDCVRNGHHRGAQLTHCKRNHLLAAPNLTKQAANLSARRRCWACTRANNTVNQWRHRGDAVDLSPAEVDILASWFYRTLKIVE